MNGAAERPQSIFVARRSALSLAVTTAPKDIPAHWRSRARVVFSARVACYRSAGEQPPVPLRDDVDGAVGDFDGGLIVNRVRRTVDSRRPALCLGHSVAGHAVLSQVRTDREVDESERLVATDRRLPLDEVLAD